MASRCVWCGTELEKGAGFCKGCGTACASVHKTRVTDSRLRKPVAKTPDPSVWIRATDLMNGCADTVKVERAEPVKKTERPAGSKLKVHMSPAEPEMRESAKASPRKPEMRESAKGSTRKPEMRESTKASTRKPEMRESAKADPRKSETMADRAVMEQKKSMAARAVSDNRKREEFMSAPLKKKWKLVKEGMEEVRKKGIRNCIAEYWEEEVCVA